MHPDPEADPHGHPLAQPGDTQHGRARAKQPELKAHDDAVRRRTDGSLMAGSRPADRVAATTPATVSSTASPVPTAKGTTSQGGAFA
jgi:hypothetical protein